jgi:hypothetical protein
VNFQQRIAKAGKRLIIAMSDPNSQLVSLRRSIIESIRSASPFTSPNISFESSPRPESVYSGRRSISSRTGWSAIIGYNSSNRSYAGSPQLSLVPTIEEGPPPDLDRSVDLFFESDLISIDPCTTFQQLLPVQDETQHAFFALPPEVRRKIYGYCFPDEHRKISLSPRFATKAVFPKEYFASPWDVIAPISGGLQAFHTLRVELMTYFWTQYHFHITISHFSGPKLSPLSNVWLFQYLDIIQYLDIEADLTRFGGSALKTAPEFGYNMCKVNNLFVNLIKGLVKRQGKSTMAGLYMMCRRYAGFRPYDGGNDATFEFEPGKL